MSTGSNKHAGLGLAQASPACLRVVKFVNHQVKITGLYLENYGNQLVKGLANKITIKRHYFDIFESHNFFDITVPFHHITK